MDNQRKPSSARALKAAWLCLATLPSLACAQLTPPLTPTNQGPQDTGAIKADASLNLSLRVSIGSETDDADPIPLLAAAIEPVSFRLLREPSEGHTDSLIRNGVTTVTTANDDNDLNLTPTVSMSVGRHSALLDGGIAAERGVKADPLRGFAGTDSNFDLYDLSLRWAALAPGPVELGLLGGLRAIQSVGGMWRTELRPAGPTNRTAFRETYDEDRTTVALPVVGGDVRFHLADGVTLSSSATTHSSGSSAAFFDMIMETSFDLGDGIGFHAGYQELRSAFDQTGLTEPINESGLFARLTIQF